VPKAVGGAVERNRIKRQLREVWQARLDRVPAGNDYVLIVRSGLPDAVAANGFDWLAERVDEVLAMTKAAPDVPHRHRRDLVLPRHLRRPFPTTCKYHPSCSQYAVDALRANGLLRGSALAAWRLLRCNPWSHGGFDPAPPERIPPRRERPHEHDPLLHRRFAPDAARACGAALTQLAALQRRIHVGVVDRRPHRDRPDAARAVDGEADPLDAEPAALRAADEGDPEEVQAGQAEAERGTDEVLPGEPDQPGCLCLPMLVQLPVFIALYYSLRTFAKEPAILHPGSLSWLHFIPSIADPTTAHWGGYVLLVVYVASQMASTLFMASTVDKMQRYLFMVMPLIFVFVIAHFPAGLVLYWVTTNLWTVGQG
jgi:conserved hypothetical protein YidD